MSEKRFLVRRPTAILNLKNFDFLSNIHSWNGKKNIYFAKSKTNYNTNMKKALGETQTLRAGLSNAKPKIFSPLQSRSRGEGRLKFNQLEMVTTFTYRPTLVKIDTRNFELSWLQTHTARPPVANTRVTDRTDNNTLRR